MTVRGRRVEDRPMTARVDGSVAALAVVAFLLVVVVAVAGAHTAGYDHRHDTVSRLASPGQPHAGTVRAALVAVGVSISAVAWRMRRIAGGGPAVVRRLLGVAGACVVVAGVVPKDPPDVAPTLVSGLHVAAVVTGLAAVVGAMAWVAWRSPRRTDRRASSAAVASIAVPSCAFPFLWETAVYGVLQRVILGSALAWLVVVAGRNLGAGPGEPGHRYR
jgi:hypothetical protein